MIKRGMRLAVAAGLVLGLSGNAPAAPADTDLKRLRTAAEASYKDDCATVLKAAGPLVRAGAKTELDELGMAIAYEIVTRCDLRGEDYKSASEHALRGTALEPASDLLWRFRLFVDMHERNAEGAVATIEAMSLGRGRALNSAPLGWMWEVQRLVEEKGDDRLHRRLLDVLGTSAYAPDEADGQIDGFVSDRAAMLAKAGQSAEAEAAVRTLTDAHAIAEASLDPDLRRFYPQTPDIKAALQASFRKAQYSMALHPDRLDPLINAVQALRALGRHAEALALLESVRPQIDDPSAFTDRGERLAWWWDEIGRNHAELGHYDESAAAFAKGAVIDERGLPNVSQMINLAAYQLRFGRAEEALKSLAPFADPKLGASPFGYMQMRYVRGCAHAVAGRPGEAEEDLAYARAHEKDHPEALADLLLCLGDMDGAAAAFIRRLDDPERRVAALLQLSDFDPRPAPSPLWQSEKKIPALKTRADVKAAIARAGGIRRFNVTGL